MRKYLVTTILFFLLSTSSYAWYQQTHKQITEYAWQNSVLNDTSPYLFRNLNMQMTDECDGSFLHTTFDNSEFNTVGLSWLNINKPNLSQWLIYGAHWGEDAENIDTPGTGLNVESAADPYGTLKEQYNIIRNYITFMRGVHHFYNPFWDDANLYKGIKTFAPINAVTDVAGLAAQEGGLMDNFSEVEYKDRGPGKWKLVEYSSWIAPNNGNIGFPAMNWAIDGYLRPRKGFDYAWHNVQTNEYSWRNAREYFYYSLTFEKPDERSYQTGKYLRALGQSMHLLQDMSVSEHTRNDAHPGSGQTTCGLEKYGIDYVDISNMKRRGITQNTVATDYKKLNFNFNMLAPSRNIEPADFFDQNRGVCKENQNPVPPNSFILGRGLAEFTCYNFLSSDTLPTQIPSSINNLRHMFSSPTLSTYEMVNDDAGKPRPTWYKPSLIDPFASTTSDPFNSNQHQFTRFDGVKISSYTIAQIYEKNGEKTGVLSDVVHKDNLDILFPRVINYSTEYINYFFRAEFSCNTPFKYQLRKNNQWRRYTISYVNRSSTTESINPGSIELYYDQDVNSWETNLKGCRALVPKHLFKAFEINHPLFPANSTTPFVFYLYVHNSVFADANPTRLVLVYCGDMGAENMSCRIPGSDKAVFGKILELGSIEEGQYEEGIDWPEMEEEGGGGSGAG